MKRSASVRFDGVLGASERDEALRRYLSDGATATSWATTASRSYATFVFDPQMLVAPPALAVLRVTPASPRALAGLAEALGGPGAPAGTLAAYRDGDSIVVEFDPTRSPLHVVVATIDAELATTAGRTIEPLVPLDDATLASFAGFVLGDPGLDASRLIETYLEPLLASRA